MEQTKGYEKVLAQAKNDWERYLIFDAYIQGILDECNRIFDKGEMEDGKIRP